MAAEFAVAFAKEAMEDGKAGLEEIEMVDMSPKELEEFNEELQEARKIVAELASDTNELKKSRYRICHEACKTVWRFRDEKGNWYHTVRSECYFAGDSTLQKQVFII